MDVKEEIYKTVETIVERYVADQNQTEQVSGIVLNSINGKYTVLVNGSKYAVKDGVGISPAPNTPVWICVPNNNWNQAYICAGKATTQGGGIVKDVYQNNTSVLGEDNIARIRCATPEDIQQLQANFQDGVDAIGNACIRKGSTPASSSLEDTVAAIDAIQTGGNYMTKEIREDGTYYASDDGVDAYDIVVVSKDVGQPHTVVFYGPDGNIIKTQANVPYHGYASCTQLDGTIRNGLYFKGWNPHPTDIVRDTFCYPQYGDYIIDSGEIQDDWETICALNGAGYPLGSYKAFVVGIEIASDEFLETHSGRNANPNVGYMPIENWAFSPNNPLQINISMHMVKVAEGEDGTTSTWLSSGTFVVPHSPTGRYSRWRDGSGSWEKSSADEPLYITDFLDNYSYTQSGGWGTNCCMDWGNSKIRSFLNGIFFDRLPNHFKDAIKEVNKSYKGYDTYLWTQKHRVEKTSLDKIWVPSVKELGAKLQLCSIGTMSPNTFADIVEFNGIDYSEVYVPTYPSVGNSGNYAITRTSVQGNGNFGDANYNVVRMNTAESNDLQSKNCVDTDYWQQQIYIPFGFCL